MTIHRSAFRALALSSVLIPLSLHAALAQEPLAVAERLKAKFAQQGIELTWTGVTGDTSSMVLQQVSVQPVGENAPLPIGDVTLEEVTEANGGYEIGKLTTSAFSKTQDGITLDVSPFTIDGMSIPADGNTDPMAAMMMYDAAELASLNVSVAGKTAFSMENLAVEITDPVEGRPMEFTGAAEKFTADLTLVDDPQSKAVIEALGYQNISGFMEMAGSWQPSDGRMALSQYDISVENAGTIGMTFDFGGYTLDFIKSLQALQAQMATQPAGADGSAQQMAVLGLMQQLTLHGATVRFDDDTLTNKVLDFVAKMQNQTPDDIKNQAKAILPFALAALNNPELTTAISNAVNTYLDNPESLTIAVEPAQPIPFAMIAATASAAPQSLPSQLGLKVNANQ